MAFCNQHGIPHSVFLSWPDDDQDKALGYEREANKSCKGCGTRKEEWDQDKFAFVADTWTCPGCEILAQAEEGIEGRKGVKTFLVPRGIYESRQEEARLKREHKKHSGQQASVPTRPKAFRGLT